MLKKLVKNNVFMLKTVIKYSPLLIIYTFLDAVCFSMVQLFAQYLYLMRILQYIERNESFSNLVIYLLVGLIIILLLRGGQEFLRNYYVPIYTMKLKKGFESHLYEKVSNFDLSDYDNPKFYNEYIWTMHNAVDLLVKGVKSIGDFLQSIIQLIGIIAIIMSVDKLMAVIIVISVALSVVINFIKDKIKLKYKKSMVPSEKKKKYIERMFYIKDSAYDIRLTTIKNRFKSFYEEAFSEQMEINKNMTPKIALLTFLPVFLFRYFISTFAVYSYFAYRLIVENNLLISEFVVVTKGLVNLYNILNSLSGQFNLLYNNYIFVDSMKAFLEYTPKITTDEKPQKMKYDDYNIEFRNVYFKYPGQENYILENINLTINLKQSIAIVGYNGAGKTTLIKLLLRLYDVSMGEILLNEINIKKYDLNEYRRLYAAVFQDFQIFSSTIGENVMMDMVMDEHENDISKALELSAFKDRLMTIKGGTKAQMTREFSQDGVLLSGGEEQKVALARVFAYKERVAVLDEPTAALDPLTEYSINKNIHSMSENRTLILISHRLTSTIMADKIIMLMNGRIVEEGSHEKLMESGGYYSEIYKIQADKYIKNMKV